MNQVLDSHLISADLLRVDNFKSFFEARKKALLDVIENAMGKKVTREGESPPDTPDQ